MQKLANSLYNAIFMTIEYDGIEHAGYMSFMLLMSLFPFLVFFFSLTSLIGASEIGANFIHSLIVNLPDHSTEMIKLSIYHIIEAPPSSLMNLAILGSIWTSSSFVESLRTILNKIHHVSSPPAYILRRLMSILQFFIINILLLLIMLLLVIVPILLSKIKPYQDMINTFGSLWYFVKYGILFLSLLFAVSFLYYSLPNISMRLTEVLPGAFLTVSLWLISGYGMLQYIYHNQLNFIYGSIASIIIALTFFFIINFLFIYGAIFNYLYSNNKDSCKI
jgi:membrane protein